MRTHLQNEPEVCFMSGQVGQVCEQPLNRENSAEHISYSVTRSTGIGSAEVDVNRQTDTLHVLNRQLSAQSRFGKLHPD